jgi:short-subunit dehydrogenase
MVLLSNIQQTNASATSKLPTGLVAVFAGATAGIGETALKAFAKHTVRPQIYYIGRSQEAGDRLQKELSEVNAEGSYVFIKKDMSLLKNVDEVCRDIKSKETVLNVLFLSQGTLKMGVGKSFALLVKDLYSYLHV